MRDAVGGGGEGESRVGIEPGVGEGGVGGSVHGGDIEEEAAQFVELKVLDLGGEIWYDIRR
jgi:hypothetical protein